MTRTRTALASLALFAATACEHPDPRFRSAANDTTPQAVPARETTIGDLFGVEITRRSIETYETERTSSAYGRERIIEHSLTEKGSRNEYKTTLRCVYAPLPANENDSVWTPIDSTRNHTVIDTLVHEHSLADTTLIQTTCTDLMERAKQPWHYTRWATQTYTRRESETRVSRPDTTPSTTTRKQ